MPICARSVRVICAAAGALALLCCAGGAPAAASPSATGPTLLARTLLAVHDDPALAGNFEFGDVATQRALAGTPTGVPLASNKIWQPIDGIGTSLYSTNIGAQYRNVGISPLDVDIALSVGHARDYAIEARGGVHPSALRAALVRLGARPGTIAGRPGLLWGAEGSVHPDAAGRSGLGIGAVGEYDRTVLGTGVVLAGRSDAPVADLLGANPTYASDPTMVATATCLGDVIAALGMEYHGTEVAVGVVRPAGAASPRVEEICAIPSTGGRSADADAAALRTTLGPHAQTSVSAGILEELSSVTVSEGTAGAARFARATLHDKPTQAAGVSIEAFDYGAVPTLVGT